MHSVLITGGAGFIGQNLVHAWRAPVQGQKGRWDSLEVDHRLEGAG